MAKRKNARGGGSVFPALALILAWLIPGAGHVYIGRVRRGVIIFITITATFWAGVAMGGVMTVDKRTERWWFVANISTGLHGLVSWYRSEQVYDQANRAIDSGQYAGAFRKDRREVADQPGQSDQRQIAAMTGELRGQYIDKILSDDGYRLAAPTETVARAYAGVAGLLNLLCVFDAAVLALMGLGAESAGARKRRQDDGREGKST